MIITKLEKRNLFVARQGNVFNIGRTHAEAMAGGIALALACAPATTKATPTTKRGTKQ